MDNHIFRQINYHFNFSLQTDGVCQPSLHPYELQWTKVTPVLFYRRYLSIPLY